MRSSVDLRRLFPSSITQGAILLPDGTAVGLICGGGVNLELMPADMQAHVAQEYHRLLMNQEGAVDIYQLDYKPEYLAELTSLHERQQQAVHHTHAEILGCMADRLLETSFYNGGRAKQTLWAIAVEPAGLLSGTGGTLRSRFGRTKSTSGPSLIGQATLATAVAKAKEFAARLARLGGVPAPYLPLPEQIALILRHMADPIREQRYPIDGPVLERVRRLVTDGGSSR